MGGDKERRGVTGDVQQADSEDEEARGDHKDSEEAVEPDSIRVEKG